MLTKVVSFDREYITHYSFPGIIFFITFQPSVDVTIDIIGLRGRTKILAVFCRLCSFIDVR